MKIIVPIKRVIDYNVKVRVKSDETGVDLDNVKMSMNPLCEVSVEEAIRIKESGKANEVLAVSIGQQKSQETLRAALAMGVDRAVLVKSDKDIEPINVAKILKKICDEEKPNLVLLGRLSIDNDHGQTGPMLSALLGWPMATFVSKIVIEDKDVTATREIDGGLQLLKLKMPAIITTDLRLNEPRYASLPNIMKAKKKPIEERAIEDFGFDLTQRLETLKVAEPPQRKAGVRVANVSELVEKLRNEEKLI